METDMKVNNIRSEYFKSSLKATVKEDEAIKAANSKAQAVKENEEVTK